MNNKKAQIIKNYFEEILPYVNYEQEDLTFKCKINIVNDTFTLDFPDSSIHDVYKSLTKINQDFVRQIAS